MTRKELATTVTCKRVPSTERVEKHLTGTTIALFRNQKLPEVCWTWQLWSPPFQCLLLAISLEFYKSALETAAINASQEQDRLIWLAFLKAPPHVLVMLTCTITPNDLSYHVALCAVCYESTMIGNISSHKQTNKRPHFPPPTVMGSSAPCPYSPWSQGWLTTWLSMGK